MRPLIDNFIRKNAQTGELEPQWWKRAIFPYKLTFDPQYVATLPLTVPATGQVTAVLKEQHSSLGLDNEIGTPLLINFPTFEDSTDGTANAAFTIMMKDIGDGTQFMNQPIHILNFSGTAQQTSEFSEPLFLPTRHALQTQFAKVSGGATTMRLFLNGKLFIPWDPQLLLFPQDREMLVTLIRKLLVRRMYIYPFWFTTDQSVVIPANGTFEVDTDIGDDGHFEITHLIGTSTGAYTINILNPETKQSFTNGQVDSRTAVGTGQNPADFAVPWLIPAGKRLRFQYTDLSGSSNTVFTCLRGRRIRAQLKDVKDIQQDLAIPPAMKV